MQSRLLNVVARQDGALFDFICARRTFALNRVMISATRSGDAWTYIVLAFAGFACGGEAGRALVTVGVVAAVTSAIGYVIKRAVARPRPTHSSPFRSALVEPPDAWSFPSSHTATAIAAACTLGAAFGSVVLALALAWAFLVGVSRVYVGAHDPLDVLLGAVLGLGAAIGAAAL